MDLHAKISHGNNAFLAICENGNFGGHCLDVAQLLIDHQIDTNAVDDDGDNALILLCACHKSEKLINLLRLVSDNCSIDVNFTNPKGRKAMRLLRNRGFTNLSEEIQLLFAHGAMDDEED